MTQARAPRRLALVLKGYPRLSETFIAQEIEGLERRGLDLEIVSLRHPTDKERHPVHARIKAAVRYLPEYLYQEPLRVLRGWWAARTLPGYARAKAIWLKDLRRDFTPNRGRRFGQALVMARELPADIDGLYVHFLHTPASATRYAAIMRGLPFAISAHAKDIWTTPEWEIREKLVDARWLTTCTKIGAETLAALAPGPERVVLVYHGLEPERLPPPPAMRMPRDGSDAAQPVLLLSVGRRVEKKGFDDLLAALARLPRGLHWRFVHVGGGPMGDALKALAAKLGVADRCEWRGAQPIDAVLEAMRRADLFVLPSKIAGDGDRDGLPNVLMEAQGQRLPVVSTNVSAIPELIEHGANGLLVEPRDVPALADALASLIVDPAKRAAMGMAGEQRVRSTFDAARGIDEIANRLKVLA
jgi:colanic acid/amylovoran biosynthesis glycosyltransferase